MLSHLIKYNESFAIKSEDRTTIMISYDMHVRGGGGGTNCKGEEQEHKTNILANDRVVNHGQKLYGQLRKMAL